MARIDSLPDPYRQTAKALHRYLLASCGIVDGDTMIAMFDDFADTFAQAYSGKHWVDKERERLAAAIEDAFARQEPEAER